MSTRLQLDGIRRHLLAGKSITQIDAFRKFNTTRLATHIHVLRKHEGMDIITIMHYKNGTSYGEYRLRKYATPKQLELHFEQSGVYTDV